MKGGTRIGIRGSSHLVFLAFLLLIDVSVAEDDTLFERVNIMGWGFGRQSALGRGYITSTDPGAHSTPWHVQVPKYRSADFPTQIPEFDMVVSAVEFSMATPEDRMELWMWGKAEDGQTGLEPYENDQTSPSFSLRDRPYPTLVTSLPAEFRFPITDMAGASTFAWVLDNDKKVWQIGKPAISGSPPTYTNWTKVLLPESFFPIGIHCNDVQCIAWSENEIFDHTAAPISFSGSGIGTIKLAAVGLEQGSLLISDGTQVWGIGDNLSNKISAVSSSTVPWTQLIPPLSSDWATGSITKLLICSYHTLVLTDDGLWYRGSTYHSNPDMVIANSTYMLPINPPLDADRIEDASCVQSVSFIISNGAMYGPRLHSWGDYTFGLLGRPSSGTYDDMLDVVKPHKLAKSNVYSFHMLVTREPGGVDQEVMAFGWGSSRFGQLGNGEMTIGSSGVKSRVLPSLSFPPSEWEILGTNRSTVLFSRTTGEVKALGYLDDMPLRERKVGGKFFLHPFTLDITDAVAVATTHNIIALVYSQGDYNMLITYPNVGSDPLILPGPKHFNLNISSVTCGYEHCAVVSTSSNNYSIYQWGSNNYEQIYTGTGSAPSYDELQLAVNATVEPKIALSREFSLFALDTTIFIFGSFRRSGSGPFVPIQFSMGNLPKDVCAGYAHALILMPDGKLYGIGSNQQGQLGLGFRGWHAEPVPLTFGSITDFAAVGDSTFLLMTDLRILSFGANSDEGILGNVRFSPLPGTTTEVKLSPGLLPSKLCRKCRGNSMFVQVSGSSTTTAIASLRPNRIRIPLGLNFLANGGAGRLTLFGDSPRIEPDFASQDPVLSVSSITSMGTIEYTNSNGFIHWGSREPSVPPTLSGETSFGVPQQTNLSLRPSQLPLRCLGGHSELFMVDSFRPNVVQQWNDGTSVWFDVLTSTNLVSALWTSPFNPGYFILLENGSYVTSYSLATILPTSMRLKMPILIGPDIRGFWFNDSLVTFNSAMATEVTQVSVGMVTLIVLHQNRSVSTAGHGTAATGLLGLENPNPATFNNLPSLSNIIRIGSLFHAHMVLDASGRVYAWGKDFDSYTFGMAITKSSIMEPLELSWIDSFLNPPGSSTSQGNRYAVQNLLSYGYSMHIIASLVPLTCPGAPPGPTFECKNGIWVSEGSVTIPPGSTSPIFTGPIQVNGNLTVDPSTTLVIGEGLGTLINVSGCATISGTIQIIISEDDLESLSKDKGGRTVSLLQASCGSAVDAQLDLKLNGKSCKKVNGKPVVTLSSDGSSSYTLSGVLSVSRGSCDRWWIILVSVVGGVLLLVIIIALLAAFTPLKTIIRPFTKREKASHNRE